eukprot:60531_1
MTIEFDFLFNGRSNGMAPCEYENFFRIGHQNNQTQQWMRTSEANCFHNGRYAHFSSMWLTDSNSCCDNYLSVLYSNGCRLNSGGIYPCSCFVTYQSLKDYGDLSTIDWHHITIAMNRTQIVTSISGGGKSDYSNTLDMGMYAGAA